jgi:hypothetical protein
MTAFLPRLLLLLLLLLPLLIRLEKEAKKEHLICVG